MKVDTAEARKWVKQACEGDFKALAMLLSPETSLLPQAFQECNRFKYQSAIERLEPPQRQAILLRFHLGVPFEEIARTMSLRDTEAAKVLCERGWVRLKTLLAVRDEAGARWESD